MEEGLVEKWRAVYGDLNLWDFFVMNEYIDYKNKLKQVAEDYNKRKSNVKSFLK